MSEKIMTASDNALHAEGCPCCSLTLPSLQSRRQFLTTGAAVLAGGMMGGPLAAISKLTSAGLSMDHIKALGTTTLDYAKEKAGSQLVKEVAGSIPGLSGYA